MTQIQVNFSDKPELEVQLAVKFRKLIKKVICADISFKRSQGYWGMRLSKIVT